MRFVWWPREIRRLKAALELSQDMHKKQIEVTFDVIAQRDAAERQRDAESHNVTMLQNEVSHLKEQAVQQKQERRAIYEQRDELRNIVKDLVGQTSSNIPAWVYKPCDENGMEVRPSEVIGD